MREDLLQFIWQSRYFNLSNLFTETGEELFVLFPGELNTDQGPDFRRARVCINGVLHEGPVELHVRTSDWERHGHSSDPNYRDVILHVVWEHDADAPGGIPVLALQNRVSKLLLGQYERWMKSRCAMPCGSMVPAVSSLDPGLWTQWKETLLLQRLYRRARVIRFWLEGNRQHWEEITWWLMMRSVGLPVNGEAFEAVARSIPYSLLARYRREPDRVRLLLLGQAGLLEEPSYWRQEYRFLQRKHGLSPITMPVLSHRMRPANFPAVRLEQLTELFTGREGWFSLLLEIDDPATLKKLLKAKGLGETMKKGVLINAFVPLLFAYGWLRGEPGYQEKALRWLREEGAERNGVIQEWQRLGVSVKTAADSQSLLELKKRYCKERRCLDCKVGRSLLGYAPEQLVVAAGRT